MHRKHDPYYINDEAELSKFGYTLLSTLDEGAFSKVKEGYNEDLNKKVAIKIIDKRHVRKSFKLKFLPRELKIFPLLHHPNIIELYNVIKVAHKIYEIMEYAGHGNLLEYVELKGGLTEPMTKPMYLSLLNAFEYLHGKNIAHRDLKCENVLLSGRNEIKLSDFGFARQFSTGQMSKTFCGSLAYSSPEILQKQPYEPSTADIWALGIIVFKMVCNMFPFDSDKIKTLIEMHLAKKIKFPKNLSLAFQDMVKSILEPNLEKRFELSDIQSHSWIAHIRASTSTEVAAEKNTNETEESS